MKRLKSIIAIFLMLSMALGVLTVSASDAAMEQDKEAARIPMGEELPDAKFNFSPDESISLSELLKDHKAVVITFFQIDCESCDQAFTVLNDEAMEYEDTYFVALDVNQTDPQKDTKEYIEQHNVNIPVAGDPDLEMSEFVKIEQFPTTIIADKDRKLVFYKNDAVNEQELKDAFEVILKEDYKGGYEQLILAGDREETDEKSAQEKAADDKPGYTITVKDQNGNTVPNAFINFCSSTDKTCMMNPTDADGNINLDVPKGEYSIHIIAVPDGYSFDAGFEMVTDENTAHQIDIVITKN